MYSDWLYPNHLETRWKHIWIVLHAPFHFALLIVMVGTSKLIINWKLLEINEQVRTALSVPALTNSLGNTNISPTTAEIVSSLNSTVTSFLNLYPATKDQAKIALEAMGVLSNVSTLPQETWSWLAQNGTMITDMVNEEPAIQQWLFYREDILAVVMNSVLSNFGAAGIKRNSSSAELVADIISKKFNLVVSTAWTLLLRLRSI